MRLLNRLGRGDFLDWRERSDLFENIALQGGGVFTLSGAGEPEELCALRHPGMTSFGLSLPRPQGDQQPDPDLLPRMLATVRAVSEVEAAVIAGSRAWSVNAGTFLARLDERLAVP